MKFKTSMVLWKVRSNVVGNKIEDVLVGRANSDVIFKGGNSLKKEVWKLTELYR